MIYPDFYPFYATQGSPGFYNEEREQEKEFDLMRDHTIRIQPEGSRKKRKHSVSFWIMREAGCMMNIRIVSCSITSVTR